MASLEEPFKHESIDNQSILLDAKVSIKKSKGFDTIYV